MADATAAAKEKLAKENEERRKAGDEQAARLAKSKPTPTQEEADLAKLGAHLETHEDDGSGPDAKFVMTRQVEAEKPASSSYQTRSTQSKPPSS